MLVKAPRFAAYRSWTSSGLAYSFRSSSLTIKGGPCRRLMATHANAQEKAQVMEDHELNDGPDLPERFSALKRQIAQSIPDFEAKASASWREIVASLADRTSAIIEEGPNVGSAIHRGITSD
jgi:hypothetical protein